MRYSTAGLGRVFVVRLEDGDVVHESIEALAEREGVARAAVLVLGGADDGSRVVVGPYDGRAAVIEPMERVLRGVHEMAGVGTLFPDSAGRPRLHLHAAFGRDDRVTAGCIRLGVTTWIVGEVIVFELTGSAGRAATRSRHRLRAARAVAGRRLSGRGEPCPSIVDRLSGERPEVAVDRRRGGRFPGARRHEDRDHLLRRIGAPGGAHAAIPAVAAGPAGQVVASRVDGHAEPPAVSLEEARDRARRGPSAPA